VSDHLIEGIVPDFRRYQMVQIRLIQPPLISMHRDTTFDL
jgi:hypothetical protein